MSEYLHNTPSACGGVVYYEDLQEKFPFMVNEIGEYLPVQKPPKKRRSKKKKTMGSLIEDIIDSMEK